VGREQDEERGRTIFIDGLSSHRSVSRADGRKVVSPLVVVVSTESLVMSPVISRESGSLVVSPVASLSPVASRESSRQS